MSQTQERLLAACVLILVAVAYVPSLSGGWVWDDFQVIVAQPHFDRPWALFSMDVFGGDESATSAVYRPLVTLSYSPGQGFLGGGAVFERVLSLLLHLGAVCCVAGWARALGAPLKSAWLGAAVFGLHTGCTEAVAWISGRQDLLPTLLLLGAGWAFSVSRLHGAALLVFLAPFGKESMLVVPGVVLLWMAGGRSRAGGKVLVAAAIGALSVLGIRAVLGLELHALEGWFHPFEGIGGLALRLGQLVFVPTSADAVPGLVASLGVGLGVLALGGAGLVASLGRPKLAACMSLLLPLVPAGMAASHTGQASDRYLYPAFAALGLAVALLPLSKRVWTVAWAVPAALLAVTFLRTGDWVDDVTLFSASMARQPDSRQAAFHLAHALHRYNGDCTAAIPLYRRSQEPRAANNLQACLVETGQHKEALAMGEMLASASPQNPNPAANTARAAVALGDLPTARTWAQRAVDRAPDRASNQVLLGNILGQLEHYEEAVVAFEAALALEPENAEAAVGLVAARAIGATPSAPPEPR
jgi:hypothetical protein